MLKLYHVPYAVCPQKVRICLSEKALAWDAVDVTSELRTPQYLALNPGGYVPTLAHDARVITESRVINEYIDEAFPGPGLQPPAAYERAIMRLWTKQIDDSLHLRIFVLSFVAIFREQWLTMSAEETARALPSDPVKRDRTLSLLRQGWESEYVVEALSRFVSLINAMEKQLARHHWLAGESYSLADIDYTPYLQRLADLGLEWLWSNHPATSDWFERVRARPSFAEVLDRWVSADIRARNLQVAGLAGPRFRSVLARSTPAVT